MKRLLLLTMIGLFCMQLNAQRMRIGTQLEKSPIGDTYMIVTNPATGEQEYVKVTSVIASTGGGDTVIGVTYDGDTLVVTTNLTEFKPVINAGSLHSVTAVTIGGTVYPAGTDIQTIINATAGYGEATTISDSPTIDFTLSGVDVTGGVIDGSITPAKLDRVYLETELDADPTNEIELPAGGNNNDVLSTDGNGNYIWTAQTGGSGEATTVSDSPTVDFTLSGVDVTGGVIDGSITPAKLDRVYLTTELDADPTNEIELPTGGLANQILQTDGSGNESWVDPPSGADGVVMTITGAVGTAIRTVTRSNGLLNFDFNVNDADADPTNEIELPTGGTANQVLQTDGSGNYSWTTITAGAFVMEVYQSGNALIKATGLGVTYSLSGNVGTVTIPSGVRLEYIRINEEAGNIGNATDFTVKIVDNNADVNQGTAATMMPPVTQFVKRDNLSIDPPTGIFPFVYTQDTAPTPQMQITGYGTNSIDVTYKNVDSFAKWTVLMSF